jgi:hypothetical protein
LVLPVCQAIWTFQWHHWNDVPQRTVVPFLDCGSSDW